MKREGQENEEGGSSKRDGKGKDGKGKRIGKGKDK